MKTSAGGAAAIIHRYDLSTGDVLDTVSMRVGMFLGSY